MIKKWLSFALVCFLLAGADASLVSAQTKKENDASSTAKIKAYVGKRGTGEKKVVKVKMLNGTKLKGYISQSGEDSFTVTDLKTKQDASIAYRDVARVERNGLTKGDKIALGIVIGAVAVVAVVVGALIKIRCNNEGGC